MRMIGFCMDIVFNLTDNCLPINQYLVLVMHAGATT